MDERAALVDEPGLIILNEQVGHNLWVIKLACHQIAATIEPGQFVHLLIPGAQAHILRRPFSVYDCNAQAGEIEILYQVVGEGTDHMTSLTTGGEMSVIGPIGRSWPKPAGESRVLLVGGGVGAAPLYLLARAHVEAGTKVDVVLGAQTKCGLVTASRYKALLGEGPVMATDDGSFGYAGFCTVPAQELMGVNDYDKVFCCGPEPLMRIVSDMASRTNVECFVSMERRMACGVGACLSCVVDTVDGKKRACVDGPVFEAAKVVW